MKLGAIWRSFLTLTGLAHDEKCDAEWEFFHTRVGDRWCRCTKCGWVNLALEAKPKGKRP